MINTFKKLEYLKNVSQFRNRKKFKTTFFHWNLSSKLSPRSRKVSLARNDSLFKKMNKITENLKTIANFKEMSLKVALAHKAR